MYRSATFQQDVTISKHNCHFNAINSVHFCSITLRSNQMQYFYYLKLKTIYSHHFDTLQTVLSF
jgi:hypothetical protein